MRRLRAARTLVRWLLSTHDEERRYAALLGAFGSAYVGALARYGSAARPGCASDATG